MDALIAERQRRFSDSSSRRLDVCLDHVASLTDPAEKRRCADMYKHLASKQREALGPQRDAAAAKASADAFEQEFAVCAQAFGLRGRGGKDAAGEAGEAGNAGNARSGAAGAAAGGAAGEGGEGGEGGESEDEDEDGLCDVPTDEQKEEFRRTVGTYFKVSDDEKEMRRRAAELAAARKRMEGSIVAFMRRFRLDDVKTRDGELRCVTRSSKRGPTKVDLERRIAEFFGEDVATAEALRGNLFEARATAERTALRRVGARLGAAGSGVSAAGAAAAAAALS